MVINFICCYTGMYHQNVVDVINRLVNYSICRILIVNQTSSSILNNFVTSESLYEELLSINNVSSARNVGLNWARNNQNEADEWIYFWDEDITVQDEVIHRLMNNKRDNYDAFVFPIKSPSNSQVGNKPYYIKLLNPLNAYILGNPHFVFRLDRIEYSFDERIGPGNKNFIAGEDSLFILRNGFRNFSVCDEFLLHPEPYEINSSEKIVRYSISQGAVSSLLPIRKQILFLFLILIRPLIGLIVKPTNALLYKNRINGLLNGIKKGIDL